MILRKILKKTFFKMPLKICKGPPFFTFLTFFPPMKNEKKIAWNIQKCILGVFSKISTHFGMRPIWC